MKITATGGGGFAGITQRHEVDTATSPAGPDLKMALEASGFFAAPRAAGEEPVGADIPRWTITVDADGERHSVSFAEDGSAATAHWRTLLDRILAA
ncbi:protealysin inhibitor emfourin [Pseudoduganella lutea]|uniref:Uncharacterized protein n=1 Tax=Pseudoduganella lutea TaxID=321985 RepID=A0A4P6KUP8_9BURK|nr:protealysin inhibitor emfourin [Pseudoduganella lutea]QBE62839.1 hypothetical protein EWM63_07565 [Pseudoduganella lutea]